MTGPVFLQHELSIDLKNTDFHFKNLGKTTDFHGKTLHKHSMRIVKYFFEIHESALDSVDQTICEVQNFIILTLKVGKLG